MRNVILAHETDLEGWRTQARALRAAAIPPDEIVWGLAEPDQGLLPTACPAHPVHPAQPPYPPYPAYSAYSASPTAKPGHQRLRVPRAFLELAGLVILHSDPRRFGLLYGLLWRLTRGQPDLLLDLSDPLARLAHDMARAVVHDIHRMQGFVRFRETVPNGTNSTGGTGDGQEPFYLAWYEPEHNIVQDAAPFFARRFGATAWAILTPRRCVWSWGQGLRFGPGMVKPQELPEDQGGLEDLWRAYYKATFIPARRNPGLLQSRLPARHRRNLPEAGEIPGLFRSP